MIVDDNLIQQYIDKWVGASKAELKSRLKNLPPRNTSDIVAERKAIEALLI